MKQLRIPENFPKLLDSRLRTILGSEYDGAISAFSEPRRGSFRLNTLKWDEKMIFDEFAKKWIAIEKFVGLEWVYFFDHKDDYAIKGTDAFYQGRIYLQSLSSMLPVLVLAPEKWETLLDVCAAPGSKTTQMAMLMGNTGKIVALEQNQIRYDKLVYNCKLQWATIVEWGKIDARHFLTSYKSIWFDRIIIDAPCSAEGRISLANEKSYGFWSLENIKAKATLQHELLSLAVKALKPGGTLVYSTCTLAPEENEWVVSRILMENKDISLDSIDIGLSDRAWWKSWMSSFGATKYHPDMDMTVRILPSEETEGFYLAKVMKN